MVYCFIAHAMPFSCFIAHAMPFSLMMVYCFTANAVPSSLRSTTSLLMLQSSLTVVYCCFTADAAIFMVVYRFTANAVILITGAP